jgi:thiol-disulfide isomerase/thioredoxin
VTGVVVLLVVVLAALSFGLWRRRTDGRLRRVATDPGENDTGSPGAAAPRAARSQADQGEPLGERATLVQFSTVFCAPCRSTRVLLDEVAAMLPGVAHVEVDAESNLGLVRRLDVRRTPTVLVLDGAGRIRTRASGAPRRADVIAALGDFL